MRDKAKQRYTDILNEKLNESRDTKASLEEVLERVAETLDALFSTRKLGGLRVFSPEFARRKNGNANRSSGYEPGYEHYRFHLFSTRKLGGLRFFSP